MWAPSRGVGYPNAVGAVEFVLDEAILLHRKSQAGFFDYLRDEYLSTAK